MSGRTITSLAGLADAGLLLQDQIAALQPVAERYAIAVTPALVDLIDPADPQDPIARQFVPDLREATNHPAELEDPIGDAAHSPLPGLVHRYEDRVLLKVVHVCPVYCRFCFRREMVGPQGDGTLSEADLEAAIAYVADNEKIWEVILTGGDPLMLSPRRLSVIIARLSAIAHVGVIRIHSRVPVADPARISPDLLAALQASNKTIVLAIHTNHPRELAGPAAEAIARLSKAGLMLVSQTVLLKGINNDAEVLARLMRLLVELKVKPYYLHHPDLAPGTGHMRLTIAEGRAIVADLDLLVSGLCRPTYVLDLPGGHGKVRLAPSPVQALDGGSFAVTDRNGKSHSYTDAT